MVEHAHAPRQDNPAVSHESSDVDLRRITYWGVGLAAAVAADPGVSLLAI